MTKDSGTNGFRPVTRRSTLQALGALVGGGAAASAAAAARNEGSFQVAQGDRTFAVEPLSGDRPVEEFYGFKLPDQYAGTGAARRSSGAFYQSTGTASLQRESTTITFLYDGPNGLSLVVVHDAPTPGGDGGSATWELFVRPADAEWLVRDDAYWDAETGERAPTNYDRWATDGARHRIDWTWSAGATDGGVLGYLRRQTAIRIRPAYNERAALSGDHYAGEVTDWQFLSGDPADPDRTALALDEPVAITGPKRNGNRSVPGGGPPGTGSESGDGSGGGKPSERSGDGDGNRDERASADGEREQAGENDEREEGASERESGSNERTGEKRARSGEGGNGRDEGQADDGEDDDRERGNGRGGREDGAGRDGRTDGAAEDGTERAGADDGEDENGDREADDERENESDEDDGSGDEDWDEVDGKGDDDDESDD